MIEETFVFLILIKVFSATSFRKAFMLLVREKLSVRLNTVLKFAMIFCNVLIYTCCALTVYQHFILTKKLKSFFAKISW